MQQFKSLGLINDDHPNHPSAPQEVLLDSGEDRKIINRLYSAARMNLFTLSDILDRTHIWTVEPPSI